MPRMTGRPLGGIGTRAIVYKSDAVWELADRMSEQRLITVDRGNSQNDFG